MRYSRPLAVAALAGVSALSLLVASSVYAADEDCKNPLDPRYKSEQQKHTDKWMGMHQMVGKAPSEPLTEQDYLKIFAEGDPKHPAYQKTKESWKKMAKALGVKEGGGITPEQWQDTTNPLHPCYKFGRG